MLRHHEGRRPLPLVDVLIARVELHDRRVGIGFPGKLRGPLLQQVSPVLLDPHGVRVDLDSRVVGEDDFPDRMAVFREEELFVRVRHDILLMAHVAMSSASAYPSKSFAHLSVRFRLTDG